MNKQKIDLANKLSSEFTEVLHVDPNAREIGLISQERAELELFLKELAPTPHILNAENFIARLGYDFSGFFSFLTGNEVRALLPELAKMMLLESDRCEDLDLCFLSMLSKKPEYNRIRADSFLSTMSVKQVRLVIQLVEQLFDELDDTMLSLESYSKADILNSLEDHLPS